MSGHNKRKRRREILFNRDPHCHWCGCEVIQHEHRKVRPIPDNAATLDHLDNRYCRNRGKYAGQERTVLACHRCNQKRSELEQALQRIEELRRRAQRHPQQQHLDGASPS